MVTRISPGWIDLAFSNLVIKERDILPIFVLMVNRISPGWIDLALSNLVIIERDITYICTDGK